MARDLLGVVSMFFASPVLSPPPGFTWGKYKSNLPKGGFNDMAAIVSSAVSARLASIQVPNNGGHKYAAVLLAALQRGYPQLAEAIYELDRKQTE